MMTTMHLLLSFLVFLVLVPKAEPSFAIPGTTQTLSGYDTETGVDPICWRSNASTVEGEIDTPFPNPLVQGFYLRGEVTLLRGCPGLNYITAEAPPEFQRGERLRTGLVYEYNVSITLDIDSLGGNVFVSDKGPLIGVQILLCKLGSGFCSPFIHEVANARLAAQGILTPPSKGDSHGGTHTHSGFNFFKVPPEDGPIYKLNVTIPMLVNTPDDYFAVASVQMYVGEELGANATMRYDMANALEKRIIPYQDPAVILVVPDTVLIVSYVAIGLVSLVILFLLVETIKNRNHQVLNLTQGYFLILFLMAALVLVVSSFLFEPKNDHYCNACFPIVLMCAQLLYAITIGRLWRINAVISPLLMHTLRKKTSWSSRMMEYLGKVTSLEMTPRRRRPKNLRKQITNWQLGLVVSLFTLPQVVIQVLSLALQPQSLRIEFNADESQGRVTCDSGYAVKSSLRDYGLWNLLLLMILTLFMAHTTSQLPSLFNETKIIYELTLFSIVLLTLGLGVILVTDGPETSPSVRYLVTVVWTLSVALNTSLRIMMPKLRMVWRNEKVVVSKLVSDHARTVREDDERYTNVTTSSGVVSGMSLPYSSEQHSGVHSDDNASYCDDNENYDKFVDETHIHTEDTEKMELSPSGSTEFAQPPTPSLTVAEGSKPGNGVSARRLPHEGPSRKRNISNRMLVKCDESPSRRLLLKMVDLQEQLTAINSRIMSGIAVSEEEWNAVRKLSSKLGTTFNDDVDFAWDSDRADIPAHTQSKVHGGVVKENEHDPERHHSVRFQVEEANRNKAKVQGGVTEKTEHDPVHHSVERLQVQEANGNEAEVQGGVVQEIEHDPDHDVVRFL